MANSGNVTGEKYKEVVSNTQKVVTAGNELINGEPEGDQIKKTTQNIVQNVNPVV